MNNTEMLIRIDQKLSNLKEDVEEIKKHVKETNGKVANAHIEIAKLKVESSSCPARLYFDKSNDKFERKIDGIKTKSAEWVKWGILLVIALMPYILQLK